MERIIMLERFEARLAAGDARTKTFEEICDNLGLSRRKMNRCLKDSVGIEGQQVVKMYKNNLPLLFL